VASGINALNLLGRDGFRTGQWDQAQQLADEGVALCDAHGYLLLRWMGRHVQALLAAARGDYDTTVALADEMIRWASPRQAMNVQTYGWLVATLRPVVVIVDDLQWLDRPSASVLGFVARRLAGSRAGFLAAARSGQGSFLGKSGLPWHEVPPLDAVAAADLVSTRFPVLPPRVRERVLAEAQGNPGQAVQASATSTAASCFG